MGFRHTDGRAFARAENRAYDRKVHEAGERKKYQPKCDYCGKMAVLTMPVGKVFICGQDECKIAFCEDFTEEIEEGK